ncbi:MAG: DUF1932 domain-containing protein [Burkholderiaceae bacterium]
MSNDRSSITLIGFGEVGTTLADDLIAAGRGGPGRLSAFDLAFDRPGSQASGAAQTRATAAGLRVACSHGDAVVGATVIISAVTAAETLAAARRCAESLEAGSWYLDLNSASPGVKQAAAESIEAAGGRYVEAAVMSPIGPKRIACPILAGGPHAAGFESLAHAIGFAGYRVFSDRLGAASATKMCRSVIVKGVEALVSESMLAARHYGVEDVVLASLGDLFPVDDWEKLARYMISRTLEHGTRRAEEMREVARTVTEAGFEPLMSAACVQRQEWAPQHRVALRTETLGEMLDAITASAGTNNDEEKLA